jgi:polyether ionophore transport system permease protein
MPPEAETSQSAIKFTAFRWSQSVVSRFVARRTFKAAAFWALLFGAFVASKSAGYAAAYPTLAGRAKLATSFTSNVGLSALFGAPHDIATIAGFTVWNTLNVMVIVGSIWAFLTATKALRGEEESGRWELFLSGQTTAQRACFNALAGLGVALVVMYSVASLAFIAVGRLHSVDFSTSAALFFSLAAVSGAAMFMVIGAAMAEIMPTRSQAAGLTALVFGIFFVLRAVADTTTMHWLLWVTPLGWIEKLQPLYAPRPIWLLPIVGLIIVMVAVTVILAKRDLGDSLFADRDSAKPHTRLLNSLLGIAFRLNRAKMIAWLLAVTAFATFMGLLTKSAASAFAQSVSFEEKIKSITHSSQSAGALLFLGVIFFLLMMLIMALAASHIGSVRDDEAQSYLDNLVVGPVSRLRWLLGRIGLIVVVILLAGLLCSAGIGLGLLGDSFGVTARQLLSAGMNTIIPAIFTLGVGIFSLGFFPRLTTLLAYAVIAWSFLIDIVSSGINLNHWIVDTSILTHMSLAPATNPNWQTNSYIIGISLVLALLGIIQFTRRDLANE